MTPRAILRLSAMALWFAICAVIHVAHRMVTPSPWPRRLLGGVAWIAGARVRSVGRLPAAGTLIVANHVSWLDIPMLAGATDCAFVAKDGLRGHPFMRWLCEQNGTVFIDRERRSRVAEQVAEMERAIASHKPLCLFPEGTVSQDGRPLPFRSSLLKLAEEAPAKLIVQPVAIDYGRMAAEFAWPPGESGQANFLRLLGRRGTIAVTLHFLPPLERGQDRKTMARESFSAIRSALVLGTDRNDLPALTNQQPLETAQRLEK